MSAFKARRGQAPAAKGLFSNGSWLCDCNPRLPAIHFQVKKPGPNTGRWFYTCQKQKDDPACCKLFLWDEDAKPREGRALLGNSRTEVGRTPQDTPSKPRQRNVEDTPSKFRQQTTEDTPSKLFRQRTLTEPPTPNAPSISSATGIKRRRSDDEDNDDLNLGRVSSYQEKFDQDMRDIETQRPSKFTRVEQKTTPANKNLSWTERTQDLPTPHTDRRLPKNPFSPGMHATVGPFLTPSKPILADRDTSSSRTLSSPHDTPTPARFRDAGGGDLHGEVIKDVLNVLDEENVYLSDQTRAKLEAVLGRYSLRTQGIVKGREVARLATKAKEAKITELQHRITTLEAELEAEHALAQHLRWQAESGQQPDS